MTAADSTDDLDDLQATLWDDDANFVSSTTSDIEALTSAGSISQPALLPEAIQSTSTFVPAAPLPNPQIQQVVGIHGTVPGSITGTASVGQIGSSYQSATTSPLPQPHCSSQILSQTPSAMAPGTRLVI